MASLDENGSVDPRTRALRDQLATLTEQERRDVLAFLCAFAPRVMREAIAWRSFNWSAARRGRRGGAR